MVVKWRLYRGFILDPETGKYFPSEDLKKPLISGMHEAQFGETGNAPVQVRARGGVAVDV